MFKINGTQNQKNKTSNVSVNSSRKKSTEKFRKKTVFNNLLLLGNYRLLIDDMNL